MNQRMLAVKKRVIHIVQEQPDDSTYDEILRELVFEKMIKRGLEDSISGRVHSNESVQTRIDQWRN
jgi:predicted transcriptional regulator